MAGRGALAYEMFVFIIFVTLKMGSTKKGSLNEALYSKNIKHIIKISPQMIARGETVRGKIKINT